MCHSVTGLDIGSNLRMSALEYVSAGKMGSFVIPLVDVIVLGEHM